MAFSPLNTQSLTALLPFSCPTGHTLSLPFYYCLFLSISVIGSVTHSFHISRNLATMAIFDMIDRTVLACPHLCRTVHIIVLLRSPCRGPGQSHSRRHLPVGLHGLSSGSLRRPKPPGVPPTSSRRCRTPAAAGTQQIRQSLGSRRPSTRMLRTAEALNE